MTEPVTPETPMPTPSRRSALVGLAATVAVIAALLVAGVRAGGSAPSGGAASPEGSSSAPAAPPSSAADTDADTGEQQPSPTPTATPFIPPTLSAPSGRTATQEVPLEWVGEVDPDDVVAPAELRGDRAALAAWARHQVAWLCSTADASPQARLSLDPRTGLVTIFAPNGVDRLESATLAERGWAGPLSGLRVARNGSPGFTVAIITGPPGSSPGTYIEIGATVGCH